MGAGIKKDTREFLGGVELLGELGELGLLGIPELLELPVRKNKKDKNSLVLSVIPVTLAPFGLGNCRARDIRC